MDDRPFDPLEGEPKVEGVMAMGGSLFPEVGEISLADLQWDTIVCLNRVPVLYYGQRLYGVVDHVPGFFYVATLFFHLYRIPIVPTQSWICVLDTHGHRGVSHAAFGLNLKSICMAWMRAITIGLAVPSGVAGIGGLVTMLAEKRASTLAFTLLFLSAAAVLLWKVLRRLEYAGLERGKRLAIRAGFPEDVAEQIGSGSLETSDERHGSPVRQDASEDFTLVPCPNCGRRLSRTTRICPRCEWRKT